VCVTSASVRAVPIAHTRELRQLILRPHETLEQLAADEPPDGFALGAFDGDQLVAVGFVAADGPPGSWRVRAMATTESARGRGTGTAILEGLLLQAREHRATRAWCNARSPARSFYERAGFHVVSEEFEIPPIGPHFVMERALEPR
jgi:GNAT superfamily N-acetyltransferase